MENRVCVCVGGGGVASVLLLLYLCCLTSPQSVSQTDLLGKLYTEVEAEGLR